MVGPASLRPSADPDCGIGVGCEGGVGDACANDAAAVFRMRRRRRAPPDSEVPEVPGMESSSGSDSDSTVPDGESSSGTDWDSTAKTDESEKETPGRVASVSIVGSDGAPARVSTVAFQSADTADDIACRALRATGAASRWGYWNPLLRGEQVCFASRFPFRISLK